MTLFYLSVILFFLSMVFFLYPIIIYPLILLLFRVYLKNSLASYWLVDRNISTSSSSIGILLCAHNEESVLESKLADLVARKTESSFPVNIYIYLDGCTDRSAEICRLFGDAVRLINSPVRTGKSVGMRCLAKIAREDLFVFTDANVLFSNNLLQKVRQHFINDTSVGCILAHVSYKNALESDTARSEASYWRSEEHIKKLETEVGSAISGTGAFFAIRRELYVPTPDDIVDDFHTTLNVLFFQKRIIQASDVVVFERATTDSREQWNRKIRISCRSFNCYRLLRTRINSFPWVLRFMFYSHKFCRWFSAIPIIIAAGASVFCMFYAHFWLGMIWILCLAILEFGYALHIPLLSLPGTVVRAILATTLGVFYSFRGERFVTWQSPRSTR